MAESLTIKYANEFSYTDKHVTQYIDLNDIYRLTIYINPECILDLNLQIPEIDFKNCYDLVKDYYHMNSSQKIIIAVIDRKIEGTNIRKIISHGMFYSTSGKYLNPNELCKNEKITFVENVEDKLISSGIKLEVYKEMSNQGIDLFNLSSPFYNDVCFQYDSDKDIALKDRILVYFPNISLCEEKCELRGINMTSFEAICECVYSETQNIDSIKQNALVKSQIGDIEEILNSINIYLLKCINLVAKAKNTAKCYGGFIILVLIIIQIFFTIIYFLKSLGEINKYVFGIINNYINHIKPEENLTIITDKRNIKNKSKILNISNFTKKNAPPKLKEIGINPNIQNNVKRKNIRIIKKRTKTTNQKNSIMNFNFNNDKNRNIMNKKPLSLSNNNNVNKRNTISNNIICSRNLNLNDNLNSSHGIINKPNKSYKNFLFNLDSNDKLTNNLEFDLDFNFEEYLETEYEQMDYYDAIRKDKRKFHIILYENLINNQMILNTFFMSEPLKPRPIKIILLVLQIDLYLFVNALFFNEEYISKKYHVKKETFSTLSERFIDNLLYATLVGVIIRYIIEFFFIEEQKLKNILKRERKNIFILKYETNKLMKMIKRRYLFFIIISFIIIIFTLVHICCFNIVYKHTTFEWLIFSLLIIILIQFFSFFVCLIQSLLRFISFKTKSEKIYKLSLLLSEFL